MSESNDDKEAVGGTAMGMLRVISKRGYDRVQWNEQEVQAEQMMLVQQVVGE